MDKELLNEINVAYYRLEMKQAEIAHALCYIRFNFLDEFLDFTSHKFATDYENLLDKEECADV